MGTPPWPDAPILLKVISRYAIGDGASAGVVISVEGAPMPWVNYKSNDLEKNTSASAPAYFPDTAGYYR